MTVDLHSGPTLSTAVRAHIRSTALSLRTIAIPPAIAGVVATFLALADFFRGRGGIEFAPQLSMIPAFAGMILPIAMWSREKQFSGGHLWTLPIDRSRNALAKLVAGWMLLMITVAAFALWLLIMALITKGNITGDEVVKLLPPNFRSDPPTVVTPSMLTTVTWVPNPVYWLVPFSAATGMYAIASGFMLGIKHPFRLATGILAGVLLFAAVAQGIDSSQLWQNLAGVIQAVMYGRYGLDGLLTARTESLHTAVRLANGKNVIAWHGLPLVSDWLIATILWTSLGIAGVTAALFRHRETR